MKVFIHEYGMALLSMLMCVFLTVTASPVSASIQGAMTDTINSATDIANFDDLEIVKDEIIGSFNSKKVVEASLSCSENASNEDLSSQKNLFTVTVTYKDGSSKKVSQNDILSINNKTEDEDGITYTATIKGDKKNFDTSELIVPKITPIYAGYNSNNTTLYFAKTAKEIEDAGVDKNYGDVSTNVKWYDATSNITKVNFLSEVKPTSCQFWFCNCTKLAKIENIESLNTSKVTNMSYMFSYCNSLTSLDLSNFDTSKVTGMDSMFSGCSGLTSLDVSNFDTSKVAGMFCMFLGCSGLTSLDVSNFDTSKVISMGCIFQNCSGLTSLDLSNFDTSKVTNMSNMFFGCSGLVSLDVSNFDTSKVTDMCGMFSSCSGLASLDVSNFDTSNASIYQMFSGCGSLEMLNLGEFKIKSSSTSEYTMFNKPKRTLKIYTTSQDTRDKILAIDSSNRPSNENIILGTPN